MKKTGCEYSCHMYGHKQMLAVSKEVFLLMLAIVMVELEKVEQR